MRLLCLILGPYGTFFNANILGPGKIAPVANPLLRSCISIQLYIILFAINQEIVLKFAQIKKYP